MRCAMLYCVVRLQSVCEHHSPESINRFQKIDRRGVQNARLLLDKTPKAPTKRSLKQEQELEREELTQKTERLRKLRLAKEAGDRKKDQP
jgi:hypothetical protein